MSTVLITGGTGLIGTALSRLLVQQGYKVIILTRHIPGSAGSKANPGLSQVSYARWDIENGWMDKEAVAQSDFIIHLAGAGIADKRWSKKRKQELVDSRTKSSALIVQTLKEASHQVQAVISASAIGWYGENNIKPTNKEAGFSEDAPPATDFLGETCRAWEASIEPVQQMGIRLVKLRTGIVLSNEGGALDEFKKPLKTGVAAILGSGEQVISWIHIEDLCRLYLHSMNNQRIIGVHNAVAPTPVTNKQFTLELARQMRGKAFIPVHVPSFALKMVLGEMSIEVLKSATVYSGKIKKTGFSFLYPSIESALQQLIKG